MTGSALFATRWSARSPANPLELGRPADSFGEVSFDGEASGVGCPVVNEIGLDVLGLRRCLCRYDADDTARGIPGLEAGPVVVLHCCWLLSCVEDRLIAGEAGAEDAGERAEGGVYGIRPVVG